tara:strand:- start:176027 stop:176221 length:195 start_codon:yes stop_codon:yes gene_type:complete
MSLFEKIKLPKALMNATGTKMEFSIGDKGDFEQVYSKKDSLLNEMPSVKEQGTGDSNSNVARMM